MKRQLSRFTCHEANTMMKTNHPASREKRLPPEWFTHNLSLAHMKQTKKRSRLARSIALLVRCAFVVLMGVMALGAADIAHAQDTFVTNVNQPYTWIDKERTSGGTEITTTRPYSIWIDGGLAQEFRTGSHRYGYNMSSVVFRLNTADREGSVVLPSSVSLWSSANGVPGALLYTLTYTPSAGDSDLGWIVRFQAPVVGILEPNTDYFIVVRSTDQSRVQITQSMHEDSGALPGWSIENNLLKRNGGIWEVVEPDDVGRRIFPADGTPVLRIILSGVVLDSRSIIISLTRITEGQFKATATASAPSDIVLPITIINGAGATTVTIPAGSTESDVISVSRTPGTTFPVTVNIGNLPSPPAGYALFKTPSRLPLQVLEHLPAETTPISQRTPQVRDAIVAAVPGVNSANEVTEAHLAAITTLRVNAPPNQAVRPINFKIGDFSGLTTLTNLEMERWGGVSLPDGIFEGLNALERVSLYGSGLTSIPNSVLGLTSLKSLNIGYHGITSIPAGTFDQLTQLNTLILDAAAYANTFTSLPDGVFDKLTSLTRLNLDQNNITSLPDGVFDQLTSLESLNLDRIHSLSSLPADVFDQLTSLTSLSLQGLKPTSLPDGIFSELSSLTFLDLSYGRLTNLPAGIFSGLSSLTSLYLGRNSVDPLPLTVSLEKVGEGQLKAVAPTGAPFDIVLPVSARNGSISGGASTLTIPKGSMASTFLTVIRTAGTTAAVTVDIGTLPGLPTDVNQYGTRLHQGYTLVKSDDLPLVVISRVASGITPVSERTPQVREAILGVVRLDYPSVSNYADITETHLAGITALYLNGRNITVLKVGDFDGLTGLEELRLYNNQLTTLPEDIFDGLTALTTLRLYGNQLSALPEDIFDELIELTTLQLGGNQFTTLPSSIFDGLTKLTDLRMIGNQFATLPEGIFDGLTALTTLYLGGNAVQPLPLTVSLEKVGEDGFKATAPTGAPFDIVLPLSVGNGTIDNGATTITIPAGSLESEPLTVLRTSDRTSTVTVNIGTLPGLPSNHAGYTLVKSDDLPLTFTNLGPVFTPVNERTPQVRDQIVLLTRGRFQQGISANAVTPVHVRSITRLQLFNKSITSLKVGDFSGMSSLETLNLDNNSISSLPEDVFDGVSALKELWLQSNALTSLPADVFEDLSALEKLQLASNSLTSLPEEVFDGVSNLATLDLSNNSLSSLPEEVFDGLSTLKTLFLHYNSLASLPEDVFDGLSNLTSLYMSSNSLNSLPGDIFDGLSNLTSLSLSSNALTSLPEGVFEGLSNLTSISMHSNSARLLVTVSLERVGAGQFKAVAPTGAPFDMVLPLTITNGSISSGATTVTIPAGSVESESLTVGRTPSTTAAITVDIGTLPGKPSGHFDYSLVKSGALPLEVISGTNEAPVLTDGTTTTRTIAENTAAGVNIGTPVAATDANNDKLTYTLSGTDAASFAIDSTTGQLKTRAALNYETKSTHTVTVTVSDGSLSDTINVTINVTNINEQQTQQTDVTTYEVGDEIPLPSGFNTPRLTMGPGRSLTADNGTYTCVSADNCIIQNGQVTQGTIEVTTVAANTAPVFTDGASTTRTIAENTATGVNIGTPVAATDAQNNTLTYTLSGTDAASFGISSSTGQLQTRATLDYETKRTYAVTITVSDGSLTDTITVTINITDIDEAPADTVVCKVGDILAPGESCTYPDTDATFSVLDNGSVQWNIPGLPAWLNNIINQTSIDGPLSVTTTANGKNYHFVAKKLTSGSWEIEEIGESAETPGTANTAPVFTDGASTTRTIAENTATGVNIGTPVAATDAQNDTLTYTLSGTDAASFGISSSTGQLQTRATLDYETKRTYAVTITVSDGSLTDTITVTINVTDVVENTAPTFTDGASTTRTIAENTAANVNIGNAIAATDADNDTLTYTLGGTDAASLDINSTTGQLRTKATLDYETKSTYIVTVTISDGTFTDSITVTINITDVAETPTETGVCQVGDVLAPGESCTYPGTDTEFSVLSYGRGQFLFFTSGSGLNIKNTVINGQSYTLVANKLASGSWKIEEIADSTTPATTNNAPVFTDGASTTRTIAENTAANVNIGTAIAATDPDNDTLTYTLSGTDAASFSIDSTSGQLRTRAALDYETKRSYTVTVTVSDGTLTDTITVTINITDVADIPAETAVNIPDPTLRTKIEAALGKASGASISAAEMETLTSLTVQDASISNLTGLETATNLTTLKLGNNSVSDLSPLPTLTKLTELQLWDNKISDISAVAGLTQLTQLYLWGNSISDIAAVSGLTNLTRLYLGENAISDISHVAGLTNLTHLRLGKNSISNISAVAGLTNLTELQIGNNAIINISAVAKLTNLVWLDALNNSISDISAVANLTHLTSLMLTGNTISDISTLTGLTKLTEVFLEENVISDLSPLTANTGLGENTEIYVAGNPLSYPSIYTHIPALQARNVYVDFDNRVATAPLKISGDTQQGAPSTTLANPFVVEVREGNSATFAGVPVTFAVTAGGGRLSATDTTTNTNGRTQSTLTLGNTAGTNTVRVSVQGISQTATFTAMAITTNTAPTFTDGASTTRTIAENTATGVNIGNAITATDADNDTLTYTLGGTDAASLDINSSTGQLKTKSALDYETKRTYTVTITVSDGTLIDTIAVTINVTDIDDTSPVSTLNLLSGRTPQVRDAIVAAVPGVNSANDVTEAHLAAITSLNLNDKSITSLKTNDFSGLSSLTQLYLHNNQLTTLPDGVFAGLSSLTRLNLRSNQLTTLPDGVFAGLSSLTQLYLYNNQLTTLPDGVFAGLSSLTQLYLYNNQLTTLPDGVFAGLSSLTRLNLLGNTVNPLPLTVSLEKVREGQFKAVAPTSAPFDIVLPINVTNGSINSGATAITIPKSSVESDTLTVSRTSGTTFAVTVNIGTLPGLPPNHQGYQLAKSTNLPLEIISLLVNSAPVFTESSSTTRSVTENTATGVNIGAAIAATDAQNDTLTYTLSGTDAASFSIVRTSGQLRTRAALDYETKRSYTVTVTVSDGSFTDTIAVTINITDVDETPANRAPVFTAGTSTTRTIAENTAAGTNIGTSVAATDADSNTLTYTLNGTDAASFSIVRTSGQLRTRAALDYETKRSYTVTVTVTDGSFTDTITVTVTVTDVDESPEEVGDSGSLTAWFEAMPASHDGVNAFTFELRFSEEIEMSYVNMRDDVLDVTGGTVTRARRLAERLANRQPSNLRWEITIAPESNVDVSITLPPSTDCAATGAVCTAAGLALSNRLEATVLGSSTQEPDPPVQPPETTNTAPTFTQGASITRTVAENTATGVNIGSAVAATDADNDTLTYTLGGANAASFGINSTTGQLRTRAALDYETKRSYTITVTVTDGSLTDTITVTINVTDVADTPVAPTLNLLNDRTPQVRDAIVAAVPGVSSSNDVTEAHLNAITELNLSNKSITSLKAGDFSGLSSLRTLYLNDNQLTNLPENVFSGLSSLRDLYLNGNRLTSLPTDLFSGLSSLRQINLHTNRLTNLPADIFSGLSSLTQLFLRNNRLASLPADVFSGLSSLQYLYLNGNRLTGLPADLFSGLPSLTQLLLNNNQMSTLSAEMFRGFTASSWLWLQGNPVDPLPLTVSLEKVGTSQFKATVPAGAPFTFTLPLLVANGTISGGASTLTIPQGSVESGRLTVTRTSGTTAAVTVDIGTLPGLPNNHQGYQLAKSTDLPLVIFGSAANSAPAFTEGSSTTRTIAENTAANVNIGAAIAATDADNDILTYTLGGTDAASFDIVSTSGQLRTSAALDYETKRTYTLIVTVSDGSLTDTITVTINVNDVNEIPADTGVCKVGDVLAPGESCTYPGTDATFTVLDNGHARWNIPGLPSWLAWANQVSIGGSLSFTATINDDSYHFVAEEVSNDSWEIKEIGDDRTQQPETPEQPEQPGDTGGTPTLTASTTTPLTEATLDESMVTLTLSGGTYESSSSRIRNAVTVSTGITGVTVRSFDIDRVSDTEVTVELTFDGTDFDTNSTITFTVGAGAIADYDGTALTSQVAVTASTESVDASTASPLTEGMLDGSVVTLTLSGRTYERSGVRD